MTDNIPQTSSDDLDDKIDFYRRMFGIKDLDFNVQMKALISQEVARLTAESNYTAVKDAFDELRTTPKDSWYGTMPEILNRLKGQA